MVFIEGYAHADEWDRALELSQEAYQSDEQHAGPMLCRLWKRIETETADSPERNAAISKAANLFACNL
jgi:hypothetical protein